MKILLVNRVFHPDTAGTARFLTDLAEDLASAGHQITVVAGDRSGSDPLLRFPRNGFLPVRPPLPRAMLLHREGGDRHRVASWRRGGGEGDRGGGRPRSESSSSGAVSDSASSPLISILRIPSFWFNRQRVLGWVLNALSFYPGLALRLLRLPRHDLAVFLTDPPLVFALGPALYIWRRTPYVVWSMDVYPDVAVETGRLKPGGLVARLSGAIARYVLQQAARVIALGEVMAERLARNGVPPDRIAVVHNWSDATRIAPVPPETNRIIRQHGLGTAFVVGYTGNMGLSHDFATLIDAVRRLAADPDDHTRFLFTGSGKQANWLMNELRSSPVRPLARSLRAGEGGGEGARTGDRDRNFFPPRVLFLPPQSDDRLAELVCASAVQVVTLKPGLEGCVVPSKFYTALAAARPVLFIGPAHCEIAQVIERGGCGVRVEPGDVDGLLAALRRLRDEGPAMGAAGRELFLAEFNRPQATARIADILSAAARAGSASLSSA